MTTPVTQTLRSTGALARRQAISRASRYVLLACSLVGVAVLFFLGFETIGKGAARVSWEFLTTYPSRKAEDAGLRSSVIGTLWVMGLTITLAVPMAVGAAVWLEEFAPKHWFTSLVKLNISNLAGVPSIIYGILGLALFARTFDLGPSLLTGGLTLTLMILPMTIIASQEAIRQVPPSIRHGSLALGATKWQTTWHHVIPGALPGIMTGVILALARAAGETAALIMIGAFAFIAFDNTNLLDDFTTVPIQIYNWTVRPQDAFRENAAAGIIILMSVVLSLNLIAVLVRERFRRY